MLYPTLHCGERVRCPFRFRLSRCSLAAARHNTSCKHTSLGSFSGLGSAIAGTRGRLRRCSPELVTCPAFLPNRFTQRHAWDVANRLHRCERTLLYVSEAGFTYIDTSI